MFTSRRAGGTSVTSWPRRWIRPLVGSSKPASIRRVVDFPQPLGPRSEKNSPSATWNVASRTAGRVVVSPSRAP